MFKWFQKRHYTPFMRHYTPFMRRIGWRKRRRLRKQMKQLKANFQRRQRALDPEGQKILNDHFEDLL